jgi:hypothetical protein
MSHCKFNGYVDVAVLFVSRRNYFLAEKWGMTDNVLRLGEGGDFNHKYSYEAHTSNLRKTVIRSTEPPLLPNRCYQLAFCLSSEGSPCLSWFSLLLSSCEWVCLCRLWEAVLKILEGKEF